MAQALSQPRVPSDERRDLILDAAVRVFAERGFHGATTRELAKAAGVSEALMFRHFPSKEDLYTALQSHCCRHKNEQTAVMLESLEDSTASLIMLVHYMVAKMLRPSADVNEHEQALHRLLANSFIEDGTFARGFMKNAAQDYIRKLETSLAAAIASGDAVSTPLQTEVQHFAAMLMLNEMPGQPVVQLKATRAAQVEQAVWFALLGLGLKTEVIKREYHPKAFTMLMSQA
jgi:AcrR family transcriptional regulator